LVFKTVHFRNAGAEDAGTLAPLNAHLIRDEGHRNPMSVPQLAERMAIWLRGDYRAVIFESSEAVVGYALYRPESDHVYLRQFFVVPEYRRRGVGRQALQWLWRNSWAEAPRLRIDVLVGNTVGAAFWRGVGFKDYCITMEMEPPIDG
jgi:GNAT superfamily N-acetyltransferase